MSQDDLFQEKLLVQRYRLNEQEFYDTYMNAQFIGQKIVLLREKMWLSKSFLVL